MKKVVLTALNSSYSHTNLGLRYIREKLCQQLETAKNHPAKATNLPDIKVQFIETTINEQWLKTLDLLIREQADLYAFSCYIWNRELVEKLSRTLHRLYPDAAIIWGGPDASSQASKLFSENPYLNAIICNEGDSATVDYIIDYFTMVKTPGGLISDYSLRPSPTFKKQEHSANKNANIIPATEELNWRFPYTDQELSELAEKILYYEGSRGCVYQCTYCLSSTTYTVRYKPLAEVFAELKRILTFNPRQLKFIDRTFNSNPERAAKIWRFLIDETQKHGTRTNFHFEIAAELITDEQIEILRSAKPGLFQFEIGTQTTNPAVLKTIRRSYHPERYKEVVNKLRKLENMHIHLDLIAGLPGETLASQIVAANEVLGLAPNMLQLGFLKILPQTPIKQECDRRHMIYQDFPPYEIIASDGMTARELMYWRRVEETVTVFYNSDQFFYSMLFLLSLIDQPFQMILLLDQYLLKTQGQRKLSQQQKYACLKKFSEDLWQKLSLLLSDTDPGTKEQLLPKFIWHCRLTEVGGAVVRNNKQFARCFDSLLMLDYFQQGLKGFPDWFLSLHQNQDPLWKKRYASVSQQVYASENHKRLRFETFAFSLKGLPGLARQDCSQFQGAGRVRPHPQRVLSYLMKQLLDEKEYICALLLGEGNLEILEEFSFDSESL